MNDKKQIEDIADILCQSKNHKCDGEDCKCIKQATDLYNANCRILLEDSVVLTREEADRFRWQTLNIKKVKTQARKEFAEKVKSKIKELKQRYHEDCINGLGDEEYNGLTGNNVDEILKEMEAE